jgi:hypothetical protein
MRKCVLIEELRISVSVWGKKGKKKVGTGYLGTVFTTELISMILSFALGNDQALFFQKSE